MPDLMPVVFVGHGSPMNAIEDNQYTQGWKEMAAQIPRPRAIVMVSAHWYTHGTWLMANPNPGMIYDLYGFPQKLYEINYAAPGDPELAEEIRQLSQNVKISPDSARGYDHGAWVVLKVMFPDADIPVVQLSVNMQKTPSMHFALGAALRPLRDKGVLLMASGNVVHNLALADFSQTEGYDWADNFDLYIRDRVLQRDFNAVIQYQSAGNVAELACQTPEHFYPLLYTLSVIGESDRINVYNNKCMMGALSMTSYLAGVEI